ncbi:MAG TPA: HAMP domain-containing protein, partial [Gemmataceae bacterium]|nr:HAMP domain-containing protein [Gemmataceae bacterium]
MTIRTKLLIGALLLLLTVVGVGGFAVYGVTRISSLLTQTYDGALMASVHAEQAHTSFIKVDRALRNALASRTVDEFDRHVAAAETAGADVLSDLDVVAERKWSPEAAKLVGEIKALIAEKQMQRTALLPGLRQQLAGGSPASLVGVEPVTAAPAADTTPTGAARASSSGGQAPPEDSGVQIIRRKSADGKVTSPPPSSGHQVPQVGGPSADGPNVPAAPAGPSGTASGTASMPLVPQVGASARSAGQPTTMPRVPQVAGSTSPAVRVDVSAPAVVPLSATPAAAAFAVSLFEGSEGIEAKLRALADRATEAGFVFRESSRGISRIILSVSIGALVAAILITGAAVFLFGRWIANPLGQVIQRLHSLVVGQGTLEQRLAATKELPVESADEIGQLRASFNATVTLLRQREGEVQRERRQEKELQESIGNFLNVANQIARGDLTKRGSVTNDSLGRVVESINRTVETLGTTVSDVQATSERVSTTAREMLVSSQRLAT